MSSQSVEDKQELYKRMVFNILVNNDDDHLRNHGFIHVGDNKWQLSKLYDVVPRDQSTSTFRLALKIGDYGKEASKRNAISACFHFGLSKSQSLGIWGDVEEIVVDKWEEVFSESGLTPFEVEKFSNSIGAK